MRILFFLLILVSLIGCSVRYEIKSVPITSATEKSNSTEWDLTGVWKLSELSPNRFSATLNLRKIDTDKWDDRTEQGFVFILRDRKVPIIAWLNPKGRMNFTVLEYSDGFFMLEDENKLQYVCVRTQNP